jgi:hypothetical protein
MKKLKTILKTAIVIEVISIPILAMLMSNSSCSSSNNGTDCGVAGLGAFYMIFPLGLTALFYVLVRSIEFFRTKSAKPNQKPNLFWILMIAIFILAIDFLLYFQSIT